MEIKDTATTIAPTVTTETLTLEVEITKKNVKHFTLDLTKFILVETTPTSMRFRIDEKK